MMAPKAVPPGHQFIDSLQLPTTKAIATLSYYGAETWPKISQLITSHMSSKNIICSVGPMIESGEEDVYKPWIVVRILPTGKYLGAPLDKDIKDLLVDNGYIDPQYNIHIESGKQRGARLVSAKVSSARDWKHSEIQSYTGSITPAKTPTTTSFSTPEMDNTDSPMGSGSNKTNPRSVKHLTCWYWFNNHGGCSKSEGECLYAHNDTGRYADQPRPLGPGGRAVAGKNAERIQANIIGHTDAQTTTLASTAPIAYGHLMNTEQINPASLTSNFTTGFGEPLGASPTYYNIGFSADLAYSPPTSEPVSPSSSHLVPAAVECLGGPKVTADVHSSVAEPYLPPQTHAEHGRQHNGVTNQDATMSRTMSKPYKPKRHAIAIKAPAYKSTHNNDDNNKTKNSSYTDARLATISNASDGTKPTAKVVNTALSTGLSFPASADRMTLLYSNMHSIMAARELCIGLDNNIARLEIVLQKLDALDAYLATVHHDKTSPLPDSTPGQIDSPVYDQQQLDLLGIHNAQDTRANAERVPILLAELKAEVAPIAKSIEETISRAKGQRKRAESIMKAEDNAKHVFGWNASDARNGHDVSTAGLAGNERNRPSHRRPYAHATYPRRGHSSLATTVAGESDGDTEVDEGGVEVIV